MLPINNFIIFLLKKKLFFFYINFFVLKNLNYLLFLFYFDKKKSFVYHKNSLTVNNFSKSFFNSVFLLKFLKYFKIMTYSNLFPTYSYLVEDNLLLNKNVYFLNKLIYKNVFNFYNIIYYLTVEKKNFLILDEDYSFSYPLYNFMFTQTSLNEFREFFFVNPNYFTFKKWIYFYSNFCLKFDINLLVLFNYIKFLNFITEIQYLDIPLAALVPLNTSDDFIDYTLFVNNNYQLNKTIYSSIISVAYFSGLNFINYKNKIKYLNLFFKFSKLV